VREIKTRCGKSGPLLLSISTLPQPHSTAPTSHVQLRRCSASAPPDRQAQSSLRAFSDSPHRLPLPDVRHPRPLGICSRRVKKAWRCQSFCPRSNLCFRVVSSRHHPSSPIRFSTPHSCGTPTRRQAGASDTRFQKQVLHPFAVPVRQCGTDERALQATAVLSARPRRRLHSSPHISIRTPRPPVWITTSTRATCRRTHMATNNSLT
jgi:hypothetical protein